MNVGVYEPGDEDGIAHPRVTLLGWLAADGEYVRAGQPIAHVETADANAEVPAWASGYLRHNANVGDLVRIDEPFAMIEVR